MIEYRAKVKLAKDAHEGLGEFDFSGLTKNIVYLTIGLVLKGQNDGSDSICFILKDDNGTIVRKGTSIFKIVQEIS
uniref:Uncharacterized protein n=1 Tax=viral metagenome TaxID=1070528 RepID=A0A6M3J5M9_9ZZZZ